MLIFSITDLRKVLYLMESPERRVWGERRLKDKVTSQIVLVFTLTSPKTFTWAV
jgi:hypothetical protein